MRSHEIFCLNYLALQTVAAGEMADNRPIEQPQHGDKSCSGDPLAGVVEISPNKRYIRFGDIVAQTINGIQSSFKAFDTKNGIEVAWHHINLNALQESEQSRVTQVIELNLQTVADIYDLISTTTYNFSY